MEKIRIVVEMYGGTIQGVHTDKAVELDVVFLESTKYVEDEPEFPVKSGQFEDLVVFTRHEGFITPKADIEQAFKAADLRAESLKDLEEGVDGGK